MSTEITTSAPQFVNKGIKDVVPNSVVYNRKSTPQHMAHLFIFAATGPEISYVGGGEMADIFGMETFNVRGKFYNHQTAYADLFNSLSNPQILQRLKPSDAPPPASVGLAIEIVTEDVATYERDAEGEYVLDAEGERIPTGTTTPGNLFRWVLYDLKDGKLGQAKVKAGTLTSTTGAQSQFYPIGELQTSFFGELGNLSGFRLYSPTTNSSPAVNERLVKSQNAYVYRFSCIKRSSANVSPVIHKTLLDESYVDFTFKPNSFDPLTDVETYGPDILLDKYRDLQPINGSAPRYGLFNGSHFYQANIDAVSKQLFELEKEHIVGYDPEIEDQHLLINLLGDYNWQGVPAYTYVLQGAADGEVSFSETASHYARGGGDGTISPEMYEELVNEQVLNYGDLDLKFLDTAAYPMSFYWDTGVSLATKLNLATLIGKRKDIVVALATQDVSLPQNTASEEYATAIALRTRLRMFPESDEFGTPATRGMISSDSGWLSQGSYKKLLPMNYELANKFAGYMGSSDATLKNAFAPDRSPNNHITKLTGLKHTYKNPNVRNTYWDAGIIWAECYDQNRYFIPAIRTVYDNDSSILTSGITVAIIVNITKVCENIWRDFVGRSDLSDEQICSSVDAEIVARCTGKYDGRVKITPKSEITARDKVRATSWTTKVIVEGKNMKTVQSFYIQAQRESTEAAV